MKKILFFHTNRDYFRFICGLYRFNNKNGALRLYGEPENYFKTRLLKKDWLIFSSGHYCLIIIICFLEEVEDGGVVEFTKRIGNGFTKYVNIKNDRSGYLFQNKAKIILAEGDAHFLYLPFTLMPIQ